VQREVNCRISNTIIQYIREYRPEALPFFLEGYNEANLTNEHYWITAEEMDILYQRAEKIFNNDTIMFDIGRKAVVLGTTGIVDLLFRLDYDPVKAIQLSVKYASLFSTISRIRIRELSSHHAVIERRAKKKTRRGACYYTRGLYQGMLEGLRLRRCEITETHCAIPIWERGIMQNQRFTLEKGHVWREDLRLRQKVDMGPLASDGSFLYEGVRYGAPSCIYHLKWSKQPILWLKLLAFIRLRSGLLDRLKRELFYEYEIVERQNRQLRRNNRLLEKLLQEKTQVSQNLEKQVNARTLELEDTVTQLKELDEMKSYFLSLTSHELRTPLTIIKGALNLLLTDGDQLDPERFKKYLHMAKNNADHLNVLISNLLDLSRLESGQLKLELERVDMVRLLRESVEQFREMAKKNNIRLSSEISVDSPYLLGDPVRVRQILDNLLSNAIKFTPPQGEIRVQLRIEDKWMEIRISDTGIGMEEWEKEKIFRKFQQAERSLTRESAGVGLGLTIVKDLVELHEGTIRVESEKGKGATFIIQMPQAGPQNLEHIGKKVHRDSQKPPWVLESK